MLVSESIGHLEEKVHLNRCLTLNVHWGRYFWTYRHQSTV